MASKWQFSRVANVYSDSNGKWVSISEANFMANLLERSLARHIKGGSRDVVQEIADYLDKLREKRPMSVMEYVDRIIQDLEKIKELRDGR